MGRRLDAICRLPLLLMLVVSGAAAVCLSASGCRRSTPKPIAAVASSARPDRLGPHEPPPGAVEVWGLSLPTGSKVERGFGERTYVTVPLSPEAVVEHLRAQAVGALELTNAAPGNVAQGVVIPHLRVRGAEPDQLLWVRVGSESMGSSRVTVERVHLVAPPSAMEHDDVMRKAGLTPDGRLLNPAKQE